MYRRRELLAIGAAAATGGCGAMLGTGCGGVTIEAEPGAPVAAFREYAAGQSSQGPVGVVLAARPEAAELGQPLSEVEYVTREGTVYWIRQVRQNGEPGVDLEVRLSRRDSGPTRGDGEVRSLAALPPVDRRQVRPLLEERPPLEHGEFRNAVLGYDPDEASRSFVAAAQDVWFSHEERTYRLWVGDHFVPERSMFSYRAFEVGAGDAALRAHLDTERRVDLNEMDATHHDIVRDRLENGYDGCIEHVEFLHALEARLTAEARLPWTSNRWYVGFEGTSYVLSLRTWSREP